MTYRFANEHVAPLLAELNHQLIQDEGHRNPMDVPELTERIANPMLTQRSYQVTLLPL